MPENEEQAVVFEFVRRSRPAAHFCVNEFFHNSLSCSDIQGSESCVEKKQRKKRRGREGQCSVLVPVLWLRLRLMDVFVREDSPVHL